MPHLVAHADAAHAHRALAGLVSNAVKFTPTGGRVQIEVAQVADDVMITVTDNGPGMADDTLSQAFDPFYRGEFAGVAASPGTGLGLTIARKLARWNGGEVRIVSQSGRGTKATLLLRRDTTEGA
ncbi:sensor histidine kinase [Microbacterium paulum]